MGIQTAPVPLQTETGGRSTVRGLRPSVIRLRAFLAGLILIPLDNCWVLMMEKVRTGPYPTTLSILANAVFVLIVLIGINALARRFKGRTVFTAAEMLLIYTMVALAAVLAGHDMLPNLVGTMTYHLHMATPENRWAETFVPHLPRWLQINDQAAVDALYRGNSSLYSTGYWLLWLWPALWWLAFLTVAVFVMMCINTLVRKQWTDRERLTFPMVTLPVAMAEPEGSLWKSRLFWIAFAASFFVDLVNGIHVYLPSVPAINVGFENRNLTEALVTKPWNALGWTPYSFYPFVIGIGYLLPADLTFSCWFFYLFWKFEKVFAAATGWGDAVPGFPFERNQWLGGFLAMAVTLTWTSRSYLKQVWLTMCGRDSELNDSDEAMSYRTAAVGALLGLAFLVAFMVRIGMSPLVAIIAFLIYFMISTVLARIRAELGPPVHDFHFTGPDFAITSTAGIGRLSDGDLIGLSYFWWFNRAYRGHPMPVLVEGSKMADTARASQRKFFLGIMLAAIVGTIATFWGYLHVGYKRGFEVGVRLGGQYAYGGFKNLMSWWARPENALGPDWAGNIATLTGFLFCVFLWVMHLHVLGWPFHPIGYIISGSWQINTVWVPLFLAWLIKVTILRYGGLKLYKTAMPVFLGLIVGEMTIGCIWSLIGITFDIPYYNFWGM